MFDAATHKAIPCDPTSPWQPPAPRSPSTSTYDGARSARHAAWPAPGSVSSLGKHGSSSWAPSASSLGCPSFLIGVHSSHSVSSFRHKDHEITQMRSPDRIASSRYRPDWPWHTHYLPPDYLPTIQNAWDRQRLRGTPLGATFVDNPKYHRQEGLHRSQADRPLPPKGYYRTIEYIDDECDLVFPQHVRELRGVTVPKGTRDMPTREELPYLEYILHQYEGSLSPVWHRQAHPMEYRSPESRSQALSDLGSGLSPPSECLLRSDTITSSISFSFDEEEDEGFTPVRVAIWRQEDTPNYPKSTSLTRHYCLSPCPSGSDSARDPLTQRRRRSTSTEGGQEDSEFWDDMIILNALMVSSSEE